jgi:hypothetical protein
VASEIRNSLELSDLVFCETVLNELDEAEIRGSDEYLVLFWAGELSFRGGLFEEARLLREDSVRKDGSDDEVLAACQLTLGHFVCPRRHLIG